MVKLRWIWVALLCASEVFAAWKAGDKVEIKWSSSWYPGVVLETDGAKTKIRYDGYSSSWDEWVTDERLRAPGTAARSEGVAAPASPSPSTATAAEKPKTESRFAWPVRPEGAKAGLNGSYLRVESWFWNGRLSLTNHGWFFTDNGRFSRSPVGGFDLEALKAAADAGKRDGVYWFDGDTLVLQWADGSKPSNYTYAPKEDGFTLNGIFASPVKALPKSWRLDGTYEGGASVAAGGGLGTSISSSNTLVFRADGTFARSAVASFTSTGDTTQVSGGSQGESAGSYLFDGHTLTLAFTDGTVKKHTVFAFGDLDEAGRPEYLYRDGTMMKRR